MHRYADPFTSDRPDLDHLDHALFVAIEDMRLAMDALGGIELDFLDHPLLVRLLLTIPDVLNGNDALLAAHAGVPVAIYRKRRASI